MIFESTADRNVRPTPEWKTSKDELIGGPICPACKAGDHEIAHMYHKDFKCSCACNEMNKEK